PAWQTNGVPFPIVGTAPLIAVVLDLSDPELAVAPEVAIGLGLPVSVALLPEGENTPLAEEAQKSGVEVLTLLPMEGKGTDDPGPDAVGTAMSDGQIQAQVSDLMGVLPGAVGAANFLGSLAMEDLPTMRSVATGLNGAGYAFVENRVTPNSVAGGVMVGLGLPYTRSSRFVSNSVTADEMYLVLESAALGTPSNSGAVLFVPATRDALLGLQRWAIQRNGRDARLAPVTAVLRRILGQT
ncbi:MAG: divergent polysaccharide deacetylase family protein, partial [Pseudomonadota bacterium]